MDTTQGPLHATAEFDAATPSTSASGELGRMAADGVQASLLFNLGPDAASSAIDALMNEGRELANRAKEWRNCFPERVEPGHERKSPLFDLTETLIQAGSAAATWAHGALSQVSKGKDPAYPLGQAEAALQKARETVKALEERFPIPQGRLENAKKLTAVENDTRKLMVEGLRLGRDPGLATGAEKALDHLGEASNWIDRAKELMDTDPTDAIAQAEDHLRKGREALERLTPPVTVDPRAPLTPREEQMGESRPYAPVSLPDARTVTTIAGVAVPAGVAAALLVGARFVPQLGAVVTALQAASLADEVPGA